MPGMQERISENARDEGVLLRSVPVAGVARARSVQAVNGRGTKEVRRWISVHHAMPAPGQDVLVVLPVRTGGHIMRVAYVLKIYGELRWFPGDRAAERITHWMPLPEEPKD